MNFPFDKPLPEFLTLLVEIYPTLEYPEAAIPAIARKASAGYAIQQFFPNLLDDFSARGGAYAYAISEPGWKGSPLNLKSILTENSDGTQNIAVDKSFIPEAERSIFVVRFEDAFAFVLLDTELYRAARVKRTGAEASYRIDAQTIIGHYSAQFTLENQKLHFKKVNKRQMLSLGRAILYRELVGYALVAGTHAQNTKVDLPLKLKIDALCAALSEEPSKDNVRAAKEILSASLPLILREANPHGFWLWAKKMFGT